MINMLRNFVLAITIGITSLVSAAQQWSIVLDKSELRFSSKVEDIPFDGTFKYYEGQVTTNDDNTPTSIELSFDLTSVDSQQTERDEMLVADPFFNTLQFPKATYHSKQIQSLGNDKFSVDGELTINGISKSLAVEFIWKADSNARLVGDAAINRLDFNVGTGEFVDADVIPLTVTIHFDWTLVKK